MKQQKTTNNQQQIKINDKHQTTTKQINNKNKNKKSKTDKTKANTITKKIKKTTNK